jgi:NADPH:quinone reductase-like Zn-dependent oxidoreductase
MLALRALRPSPDDPLAALDLGDRPDPEPPPGWEIVQVRAASLNHHDLFTLRGAATPAEYLPIVLGSDAAGVTSDGREVVCHAVVPNPGVEDADETDVFGRMSILSERYDGTHAEKVAVPRANLLAKPPELSFAEAACLPTAWLTAYRMLFVKAQLRPGDRVLVQGSGGGLATAAIMLGRAAGLTVYATSRDAGKRTRATELGARDAFEPGARLPERVEAVVDSVGEATFGHSLRSLAAGGTLLVPGATSGPNPPAELHRVFARQLRIVGSAMGTRAEFAGLLRLLAETGLRPVIDAEMPLDEGRRAYERLAGGDVFGKIVLVP